MAPNVFSKSVTCGLLILVGVLLWNSTYRTEVRSDMDKTDTPLDITENDGPDKEESELTVEDDSLFPSRLLGAHQEDAALIDYIREYMFVKPAPGPLNLKEPNRVHYSQIGQSEIVDKLLHERRNGFFIECGAATGETFSNSLFFEKTRNWTGLLIEANPSSFDAVRRKRRVKLINGCLSPIPRATVLNFTVANMMGGLTDNIEKSHLGVIVDKKRISGQVQVPCLPLYSILKALNVDHVDYFSLDVEGPEIEILQTIPFDKITFDVLTVEFGVQRCAKCTDSKLKRLNNLMARKGYMVKQVMRRQDVIYTPMKKP